MADASAPKIPQAAWSEILRALDETGVKRRDGVKRIGRKAFTLAKLARAGMPVPRAWVLDARHFDTFVGRCLPRKHDLRSLIKLSGSRAGDERCARAYEQMLSEPLDPQLVEAIEALWHAELSDAEHGVAVRPSLAASGALAGTAMRHLHSLVGLRDATSVANAVRRVWASSVLASAVHAYAEAAIKDVSMAVIVQQAVPTDDVGLLTRTTGPSEAVADADWHLGVLMRSDEPRRWLRRAQLLLPLSLGKGGAHAPAPLARMRDVLEPGGFEQLLELGSEGEKELGKSAVFHFAVDDHHGDTRIHVLNADESPRWQALSGGDESTTWTEVTLGGRSPEPPTRLSQSIIDRLISGSVDVALESISCTVDEQLMSSWSGRSYVNLNALLGALGDVPLLRPEDVLHGVGGVGADHFRALAGRAAAAGRSRWRMPLIGGSALAGQIRIESDITQLERAIENDARGLADMDLTLLPSDAMATTLVSAQALLERSAELWARCTTGQLAHMLSIRALLRRRIPEVDPHVGYSLTRGAAGLLTTQLTTHTGRLVETFRRDPNASAHLLDATVRLPADLPDGQGRGALGQLLSRYGDVAFSPFELSTPRWREDARDLMRMVSLLSKVEGLPRAEDLRGRAAVDAAAELASYEPELSLLERRLLRTLLDRSKELLRRRATVDRLLLRALSLVRKVVGDIDRRLRRIDTGMGAGGAFHCSVQRLVGALKSGRPELSRIIRMRVTEREQHSKEPAPPISFVASPPRGGIPIVYSDLLEGIGVSRGVVEGRVRIARDALPSTLEMGDILVVTTFEPALAPLCLVLGGIVSEAGGALSLGAEAARELAVPAVMSVANASLHLREGERVRVDGTRGTVQRVGASQSKLESA
jgi:phosphohistidine swiveling domain-containing protein